uniref:CSON002806 protein n=1 Tax=Culicoides sonorensis TaxID=179676 RepID=A0A336MPM9_CULSO
MPVKMELDNESMVYSMGMDWDDATTNMALLDLPSLEFTTDDPYFSTHGVSLFDAPLSPKHQIISHDCMWSGSCGDKSHPGKTHPLNTPCSTATSISPSNSSSCNNNNNVNSCKMININNNLNSGNNKINLNQQQNQVVKQQVTTIKQEQKIPAGRSLLLNSRSNLTSKSTLIRNEVKNGSGTITRPDTPLSLDDDSPEFKHHIDLAGTIAGTMNNQFSNGRKISISANSTDETHIITLLKEHLEEDNNGSQSSGFLELLSNTFNRDDNQNENVLDYLKYLSDYDVEEEDDSAVDMDESDSDEYTSSSSGYGCSSSNSIGKKIQYNSNNCAQLSNVPVSYDYQETNFGDHSYTRPKDRFDTRDLGVQTPSDSVKYYHHQLTSFLVSQYVVIDVHFLFYMAGKFKFISKYKTTLKQEKIDLKHTHFNLNCYILQINDAISL